VIGADEAQAVGEACVIAQGLRGAAAEARRQGLPGISARMEQAADIIERLLALLGREGVEHG
jgi:hypothetical protein